MLLMMVAASTAAATTATAARPLTIVWSHYLGPVRRRTGLLLLPLCPSRAPSRLMSEGWLPDATCAGEAPSKGHLKPSRNRLACQPLIACRDHSFDSAKILPGGLGGESGSDEKPYYFRALALPRLDGQKASGCDQFGRGSSDDAVGREPIGSTVQRHPRLKTRHFGHQTVDRR